jgi:hypothetical protein
MQKPHKPNRLRGCFESKVMTIAEEASVMDAKPEILERPAPVERLIGADEAMHKAEGFLDRQLGHLLATGTP